MPFQESCQGQGRQRNPLEGAASLLAHLARSETHLNERSSMRSCAWLSPGTQRFRFILLITETTPPYELVTHLLLILELFPVWAAVNKAALTTLLQVVCMCVCVCACV